MCLFFSFRIYFFHKYFFLKKICFSLAGHISWQGSLKKYSTRPYYPLHCLQSFSVINTAGIKTFLRELPSASRILSLRHVFSRAAIGTVAESGRFGRQLPRTTAPIRGSASDGRRARVSTRPSQAERDPGFEPR